MKHFNEMQAGAIRAFLYALGVEELLDLEEALEDDSYKCNQVAGEAIEMVVGVADAKVELVQLLPNKGLVEPEAMATIYTFSPERLSAIEDDLRNDPQTQMTPEVKAIKQFLHIFSAEQLRVIKHNLQHAPQAQLTDVSIKIVEDVISEKDEFLSLQNPVEGLDSLECFIGYRNE